MLPVIVRGPWDVTFFMHSLNLSPGSRLYSVLPDNKRTDDAHYACLISVLDYHRMVNAESQGRSDWHYSNLEPEILHDVRAGRAVLVFDLSNEGPQYDQGIFEELYSWIEANSLPPGRCIWLQQNRVVEKAARTHVGERSELVQFYYYDWFVKSMAWIFSPYSQEKLLWTDPEAASARMFDLACKDKLLLCLNATPKLHRILTVAALHFHDLLDGSLVSFPGLRYVKEGASMDHVKSFITENPMFEYLRFSLEAVGEMTGLKVDSFQEEGNALTGKIDPTAYERSFISLVTESDFSDGSIDRVTEKIAKAYCMGHPTLVMGNPDSVKFMSALGFQDWDDVLDRSAEAMLDPAHRFQTVMQEVLHQASRIRSNPEAWLSSVREVGAYNIRHAVSGKFLKDFITYVDKPLVARLEALIAPAAETALGLGPINGLLTVAES
jgi:hypothetical protein